jgi:hypothetical protein
VNRHRVRAFFGLLASVLFFVAECKSRHSWLTFMSRMIK